MKSTKEKGNGGEDLALSYLQGKGYRFKARNVRVGRNEIDLVMIDKNILVFVEVKWRSDSRFGLPDYGLTRAQTRNIIEASDQYTKQIEWEGDIRFDFVAIVQDNSQRRLIHVEDAFYGFIW